MNLFEDDFETRVMKYRDDEPGADLSKCPKCGGWGVASDNECFPEGTLRVEKEVRR
jgi:hypothetical protein